MSVVLRCSSGYIINHEESITLACGSLPFESCTSIFDTFEPYIKVKPSSRSSTHSTTPNPENDTCFDGSDVPRKIKKKRKRKKSLNVGEINALEYHEKVREKIKSGIEVLSIFNEWENYFNPCNSKEQKESSNFLQAASACYDLLSVVNKTTLKKPLPTLFSVEDAVYEATDLVNRIVFNQKQDSMLVSISGAKYILPSQSKFLLSDITHLGSLIKTLDCTYDMIVIDPPWENKSVKRGSKYSSLPLWEIKKLPICDLASNMALVVVWITNKQKYRMFVLEELFPSWSCKLVGEWHWMKLTRKGEMIYDLDSCHKKPYEPFLIGQFVRRSKPNEHRSMNEFGYHKYGNEADEEPVHHRDSENKTGVFIENKNETRDTDEKTFPEHQVVCSVPCSLHSRKPPLTDIFRKYLPDDAKCIELFARSLLPNWTSWGNEVLKYQHLEYFQSKKR